jgi:hypothetical protein
MNKRRKRIRARHCGDRNDGAIPDSSIVETNRVSLVTWKMGPVMATLPSEWQRPPRIASARQYHRSKPGNIQTLGWANKVKIAYSQ